jgi:RimJ/RimL family protein N-acetyltransferase
MPTPTACSTPGRPSRTESPVADRRDLQIADRITIRDAAPDDADAIAQVHVSSWRWAYDGLLPASVLEGLSVDERATMWRQAVADPDPAARVFVAEDATDDAGRRLLGFASVGSTTDEDAPAGTGELFAIYLVREIAGVGLGAELLGRAVEALRSAGLGRGTLWVLETNERARRFYERHGWAFDGTRSEHRFECGNRPIVRYARDLELGR